MRQLAVVLALAAAAACGESRNWLDGSISEEFSLEFDEVSISVSGCLTRIDYIKRWPAATYVPCRVSIDEASLPLGPGSEASGQLFLDAIDVARASPTGRYFPELATGTLALESYSRSSGDEVRGEFSVGFADGRNLRGGFVAEVLNSDPDVDCP